MKRLYVLIDQKLDAVYGCVQGGHAVAQWLLEHPKQDWNNNYLIYLYADLDKWKVRLDLVNKDYSSFYEPDLGNQLTAIALQDDGRMFKKLKISKRMIYKRDYYVSIGDEQVIITKNAIMPYNVMEPRNKYFYKVGDKVLTPFGIQTIKDIIKDYSSQPGHEWIILVEENGNQYKPCELIGIVVKELTLEQWNQIIE